MSNSYRIPSFSRSQLMRGRIVKLLPVTLCIITIVCLMISTVYIIRREEESNKQIKELESYVTSIGGYIDPSHSRIFSSVHVSIDLSDIPLTDNDMATISDKQTHLNHLSSLFLGSTGISDNQLRHLSNMAHLRTLVLEDVSVTGEGLIHLQGLQKLYCLDLSRCPIEDKHIHNINMFKSLSQLSLESTRISDAGLLALVGLDGLHDLWLDGTSISGSGMRHLSKLPSLRALSLKHTTINDDDISELSTLQNILWLDLEGSKVSVDGYRKLKEALPACGISIGGGDDSPDSPLNN